MRILYVLDVKGKEKREIKNDFRFLNNQVDGGVILIECKLRKGIFIYCFFIDVF